MKQFKLFALVCTLLLGTTLTSCLDSDDSTQANVVYGYVKVMYGSYFQDASGNTFYPTSASLASVTASGFDIYNTNIAYIYGTYEIDESGNYIFSLTSAYSIDAPVSIVYEDGNDVTETAPVVSLSFTVTQYNYDYQYSPGWFDSTSLLVPIKFHMTSNDSFMSSHSFTMAFYPEEIEEGDTVLTIYLRHDRSNDVGYDAYGWGEFAYNLSNVLAYYTNYSGNSKPSTVVIKDKENDSSIDLDNEYTKENSYAIAYNY
ncbi:MAG: hypothetical protein LUB83_01645 [Prevotellaceae bacterium]|nr:hypothetical protein [Prevotellaceae bacterium]